ncbi:glycosyltransferase [Parapedobacter sp. ISTM3]|nr:glycosyltransferase [Parapedobacter sp. ISTM3]
MNILHLVSTLDPQSGGVATAVHSFIIATENEGVKQEVLCLDNPLESYIRNKPYVVHALSPGKSAWKYHKDLLKWITINLQKYDVIIVHGLWQYQSYAIVKAISTSQKTQPLLFTMPHGMLDPYFQQARGRRLKAIRNIFVWHLVEKNLINKSDGLFFTCEQEKILAKETFLGYRPKATFNVGLGIPFPPVYSSTMPSALPDRPYWLFLGRIVPKKGVDLLISAYNRVLSEYVDIPNLVIAGPGLNTPYGRYILQLAKDNPRIHFTGMLTGKAKWGAIYNCELFVLPSHQENFGIAIVEAMACGKPVLISDKVNIWREVVEGGGGLVDTDTGDGVYNMLKRWLNLNQGEKQAISVATTHVFETNFTMERVASRMVTSIKSYSENVYAIKY